MAEFLAEIWHDTTNKFVEWRPGQPLRLVHTMDVNAANHQAALDDLYAICNVDSTAHARALGLPRPDRADLYRAFQLRSLSVGDVVVLIDLDQRRGERYGYACAAGSEWTRLAASDVPTLGVILDQHVLSFTVPAALDDPTAERLSRQIAATMATMVEQLRDELSKYHSELDVHLSQ
jgi:hypothetical protein